MCTNQPAYIGSLIDMEIRIWTPKNSRLSSRQQMSVYESQDVWAYSENGTGYQLQRYALSQQDPQ